MMFSVDVDGSHTFSGTSVLLSNSGNSITLLTCSLHLFVDARVISKG